MELLVELEGTHSGDGRGLGRGEGGRAAAGNNRDQLSLFEVRHPVVERLLNADPDGMSPLEALNLLYDLKARAAEG